MYEQETASPTEYVGMFMKCEAHMGFQMKWRDFSTEARNVKPLIKMVSGCLITWALKEPLKDLWGAVFKQGKEHNNPQSWAEVVSE